MTDTKQKDVWDKLSSLATIIASVLIPIVVVVVGNSYSSAVKDAENRVKYTELAIGILKVPPVEGTKGIRSWAIEVINKHSGVPLDDSTRAELLKNSIAGKVDEFVSTSWVPAFARNFMGEVRKSPKWQKALSSGDPKQIEKIVEELLTVVGQQTITRRSELMTPMKELQDSQDNRGQTPF